MTRGDLVVYLAHPEWGSGLVRDITATALLLVSFEIPGHGMFEDLFHAQELEDATRPRTAA